MHREEVEARLAAEVTFCADALRREDVEDASRCLVRVLELCDEHREHLEDSHVRGAEILMDGLLALSESLGYATSPALSVLKELSTGPERLLH